MTNEEDHSHLFTLFNVHPHLDQAKNNHVSSFIKMKAFQPQPIWKAQTVQNHYKGRGTVTHVSGGGIKAREDDTPLSP